MAYDNFEAGRTKQRREPLRSFTESAHDIGLTTAQMKWHVVHSRDIARLTPQLVTGKSGKRMFFSRHAVQAWWRAVQAARSEAAHAPEKAQL